MRNHEQQSEISEFLVVVDTRSRRLPADCYCTGHASGYFNENATLTLYYTPSNIEYLQQQKKPGKMGLHNVI